jgi:hypothetical protein
VLGQSIVDFPMARHRLFLSGSRVLVDVVTSAVPQKDTTLLFKLADQLDRASQRYVFGLVIRRHFVHCHRAKSVFEVFLKLFERLALSHYFGMLQQLPEPEMFAFPVDHRQFLGHKESHLS